MHFGFKDTTQNVSFGSKTELVTVYNMRKDFFEPVWGHFLDDLIWASDKPYCQSEILFPRIFFRIEEINVEFKALQVFPWFWNSSIPFTMSSFIVSQHSWKNAIVNLGLGKDRLFDLFQSKRSFQLYCSIWIQCFTFPSIEPSFRQRIFWV